MKVTIKSIMNIETILSALGIKKLNSMQLQAAEAIINRTNTVLIAPTGSGKTLAFLLPALQMIVGGKKGVQVLIIVPSRELALQIEQVFRAMQTGFKVNSCYGGHPVKTEVNNLSEPPALLVGTPGRLADHLRRRSFNPDSVEMLVLDEFDKSLELGFRNEMEFIVQSLTNLNTRILTSATGMDELPDFTQMENPVFIRVADASTNHGLEEFFIQAENQDKSELLVRLLHHAGKQSTLVFCNHREAVERISNLLGQAGIAHGIYHGGLEQEQRELALIRFRNQTHNLLITTDLASRGIDIPEIMHVIHYQLPATESVWVHRNGRTARMHAGGKAWVLLTSEEYLPPFMQPLPRKFQLNESPQKEYPESEWETIYLSLGKKDKVSNGDIAGFLLKTGGLKSDDLGRIDRLDYASFAAVKRRKVRQLLAGVFGQKLKNKNVKTEIARI